MEETTKTVLENYIKARNNELNTLNQELQRALSKKAQIEEEIQRVTDLRDQVTLDLQA